MGFSKITKEPIGPSLVGLLNEEIGATVIFIGTVRKHNRGKEVTKILYEAYESYGRKTLEEIRVDAIKRFNLIDAYIVHRVGELRVGEAALLVAAQSPSRAEALKAVKWMIDEVKLKAPIWKKEFYTDGTSEWLNPTQH